MRGAAVVSKSREDGKIYHAAWTLPMIAEQAARGVAKQNLVQWAVVVGPESPFRDR